MNLFKVKNVDEKIESCATEKTAEYTLSDNSENWVQEINERLLEEQPSVSGQEIYIDMKQRDENKGNAVGEIVVGGKFTIPFFIDSYKLKPMDILIYKGKPFSATRKKIMEIIYDHRFFSSVADKKDKQLIDVQRGENPSELGHHLGLLDDRYFDYGKFGGDYTYMVREDFEKNAYVVDYVNKFDGSYNQTEIPFFESKNFFNAVGLDHYKAAQELKENKRLMIGFNPIVGKAHPNREIDVFSQYDKLASCSSYRVYNRDLQTFHDGIFINKIADETGEIKEGSLFISKDGYCFDQAVYGTKLAYEIESTEMASAPLVNKRGFFVVDCDNGEKVAFGPFTVKNLPYHEKGKIHLKVAGDVGGDWSICCDPSRKRIIGDSSKREIVLPEKVAFFNLSNKLNLTNHCSKHASVSNMTDTVQVYKDAGKIKVDLYYGLNPVKLSFDSKPEAIINLYAKGVDLSNVADHILEEDDTKKWGFGAKVMWEMRDNPMDGEVQGIVPKHVRADGAMVGELTPQKEHSDNKLEKKKDRPKVLDSGDGTLDQVISVVDKKANELSIGNVYLNKEEVRELYTPIANFIDSNPKLANEMGFGNFFDESLKSYQSDDNISLYISKLSDIKDVENVLAGLLLEVRMGREGIPEASLVNLVKSLGVVRDSLEVLKDVYA